MGLGSILVYIDSIGELIPGTNRKTNIYHGVLLGYLLKAAQFNEATEGEYCSTAKMEIIASRLKITTSKLGHLRNDLERLGWIKCERKGGEIVKIYPILFMDI